MQSIYIVLYLLARLFRGTGECIVDDVVQRLYLLAPAVLLLHAELVQLVADFRKARPVLIERRRRVLIELRESFSVCDSKCTHCTTFHLHFFNSEVELQQMIF